MKKIMLRSLIVMLGMMMMVSMVGCSSDDNSNNNNNNNKEKPDDNQTVSIVGKWVGDEWELRFYEYEGGKYRNFSSEYTGPRDDEERLSPYKWEINDKNTEIKLTSNWDELDFTLQCELTATTLNITNYKFTGLDNLDSRKEFPLGIYNKKK